MEVTLGDEVDQEGTLVPDVPPDGHVDEKANVYMQNFAANNEDIPVREGPDDQLGAFYTDCRGYDEFASAAEDSDFTQEQHYQDALPGVDVAGDLLEEPNDACWVGYVDKQSEYVFAVTFLANPTSDPIYFLNPATDDEDCQHGDWALAQVQNDEGQLDDCSGDDHNAWYPGSWHSGAIDTDLVEGPLGGDDGANCQEATCGIVDPTEAAEGDGEDARDYHGSGTITLPLEYTRTTFLFGYAHPDNPEASNYDYKPDDPSFSQPLWGVPDEACGDRIPDEKCQLLGPKDLRKYDVVHDEGLEDEERGRLCSFNPDSSIANPQGLQGGPCGLFGTEVDTFIEEPNAGGFGTNTVATYQSTFPGWKNPLLTLYHNGFTSAWCGPQMYGSDNTTGQFYGDGHEDYEETQAGESCSTGGVGWAFKYFDRGITAVNPAVPQVDDEVSCMRPQIKGSQDTVPGTDIRAESLYGEYQAAAIDVDIYVGGSTSVYAGMGHDGNGVPGYDGWHETFDPVFDPADDVVGEATSTASDVIGDAGDQVPEDTPVDELLDDLSEQAEDAQNAGDRVGPSETSDPEPSNQLGPDNWNYRTLEIPEGVSCQAGIPQFNEEPGEKGVGLRFDSSIDRGSDATVTVQGVPISTTDFNTLKDPTILSEDGLPASENDTTDGTWQPESYSFSTPLFAYTDENLDESFSGCAPSNGAPAPDQDSCPWTGLWDAYNPTCTGQDQTPCEELLLGDDYVLYEENVTSDRPFGVGAVSTLEVSGTTLLWTTSGPAAGIADEAQIVNQDPAQSTCVIMTSQEFKDKLATHAGTETGINDQTFDTDEREALCPDHSDDRIVEWHDAFSGQSGPNDGGLSATLNWAKISPTPDAVRETQQMQDDRLCLSFVFSTADGEIADGTEGTIQLGADSTETYYTDCDVLTSHEDEDGEPTDDHPLDGKTLAFPDYSTRDAS